MLSTPYVESSAALAEPAGPVPMIRTSVLMSAMRSSLAFDGDRATAQHAADGEKLNTGAGGHQRPQALRLEQHHDGAHHSEHEPLRGAIVGLHVRQQKRH